ncbi:MAG: hypothetical protein L0213_11220, partial [Candidatus Dadabacteria bacterium]|nr:hypothetical protein [Candidatus Dadabacteria bacterium]
MKRVLTFSILACSLLFFLAKPSFSSNDANRILSLVDYIGGDYGNAVKDGQIINTAEYSEMLE